MYVHTYVDIYFRRSRPYFLLVLFLYNVVIILGTDQEYIWTYIYVPFLFIYMCMYVHMYAFVNVEVRGTYLSWNSIRIALFLLSLPTLFSLSLVQLISCTLSVFLLFITRVSIFFLSALPFELNRKIIIETSTDRNVSENAH